jgi:putative intracellular protease/amidase
MKKQVLFILLERFADHEYPLLATALQNKIQDKSTPYEVKTISVSKNPVKSIGGFTVLPDYSIEDCPSDYAGLILIGGETWRTDEAKKIAPLLKQAFFGGKVIGAICDATVFLGMNGLLNDKKHTSNTLEALIEAAQENYIGQDAYQNKQAVRDGNLITANGTAYLEFATEVLTALDAYPVDYIENYYQFFKLGLIEFMKNMQK